MQQSTIHYFLASQVASSNSKQNNEVNKWIYCSLFAKSNVKWKPCLTQNTNRDNWDSFECVSKDQRSISFQITLGNSSSHLKKMNKNQFYWFCLGRFMFLMGKHHSWSTVMVINSWCICIDKPQKPCYPRRTDVSYLKNSSSKAYFWKM